MANWRILKDVIIAETGEIKDMPVFPFVTYDEYLPILPDGRCICKDTENEKYYSVAFNSVSCSWVAFFPATLADVKRYGLKVLELNGGTIQSMQPLK